jgi:dihydrofolate reductase
VKQFEIILIAALAETNRVIGKDGKLPWRIPEDSRRFQQMTKGNAVIMGRHTWEYDLEKRPLKRRFNVVVTSNPEPYQAEFGFLQGQVGLQFVASLPQALELCRTWQQAFWEKVFIVGGARIYAEGLLLSDRWELTLVEGQYEGDTVFPEYHHLIDVQFKLVSLEQHAGYRYETYQKNSATSLLAVS